MNMYNFLIICAFGVTTCALTAMSGKEGTDSVNKKEDSNKTSIFTDDEIKEICLEQKNNNKSKTKNFEASMKILKNILEARKNKTEKYQQLKRCFSEIPRSRSVSPNKKN